MISRRHLTRAAAIAVVGALAFPLCAQELRTMHATGTFEVKVQPQTADNPQAQAAELGRLSLDKRFHGALDGQSQGEMLASGDGKVSGAYVALEKFTGTVDGRRGSFVLMHRAALRQGKPEHWSVLVVADSGTEQLAGLEGEMRIRIEDGKHFYDFDYRLPAP